ncbi:MAG: O-antigen ligase family protein [Pseudomonadota bacterium]
MRIALFYLFISFFTLYAWKDWYKSLCALIFLMAFLERPDIPKSILEIPGLNPWNFLLAVVIMAWLANRHKEGTRWDMPGHITTLLVFYGLMITIAVTRMISDISGIADFRMITGQEPPTRMGLVIDYFINCIKYTIPGLLLFVGCNTRARLYWALAALAGMYFFLALQVIKWMPLGLLTSGVELSDRAARVLDREIGYFRIDLSMILAGGACAIFAARILAKTKWHHLMMLGISATSLLGQLLTGGRIGYVSTAIIGLIFAIFRWRKLLLLIPLIVIFIVTYMPSVVDRMIQGLGGEIAAEEAPSAAVADTLKEGQEGLYAMTSGRNFAWPFVLDKIAEAPLFGYGTLAMQNTGLSSLMTLNYNEAFPHPHNAYLEWILDTGLIGAIPVFILYFLFIKYSFSLFLDSRSKIFIAIGGAGLAIILAQLIASIGAQSFYPRAGTVAMWCAIGLIMRVYIQRGRLDSHTNTPQASFDDQLWNRTSGPDVSSGRIKNK